MNISVSNLSFSYTDKPLFSNFTADYYGGDKPLIILGPSGSGKTTLLKLLGGLLKPEAGEIFFCKDTQTNPDTCPKSSSYTAFMFQEPRLLPWLTVLDNVSLPLRKIYGIKEAKERARHFLSLVSLGEKEMSYPDELSGGQVQRVSMARAFAWPAPALFMDEPFQSLDIPLRINLMENCLSILEQESRLLIAITHDPREAVFMGGRIIILGRPGEGIVFDKTVDIKNEERAYSCAAGVELEWEIIKELGIRN